MFAREVTAFASGMLGMALLLASSGAAAAESDPAAAEALFAAGREALERGDYEGACAKFAESERLEPAPGTLMNLADCNERRGHLADAWENWRTALGTLRPDDDRVAVVERRLDAVEARLPRLVIELGPGAPPTSRVERDGQLLGPAALGVALPVNPGDHHVVVSAPGFLPRTFAVTATEGQTARVSVVPGLPLPPAITPAAALPETAQVSSQGTARTSSARTIGWVAGTTGAALIVTGGVTGFWALAKKNEIEHHCERSGDVYLCDAARVDAAHAGKTLAVISSITLPAGLALAAAGVTLILTSRPHAPSVTAAAGSGTFGLVARGAF